LLLDSARSCALSASLSSDYVLLNAISTPARKTALPKPNVQVLNLIFALPLHELMRKRTKGYKLNQHFQDSWAAKLPWVEAIMDVNGKILQVQCKVYTFVERQDKLLVAKINSL
jgi:hypothetical protein